MTTTVNCSFAILALVYAASPAQAGPCTKSIDRVQAQVDAAIEKRAASGSWKPESLNALRSRQPTPRSLAEAEAGSGPNFDDALNALNRARNADRIGDLATCRKALGEAKAVLGSRGH